MHSKQSNLSRRNFLVNTGKVSAGIIAAGMLSSCQQQNAIAWAPGRRAVGANELINLGIVGVRSRGWALDGEFMNMPNVRIKALCDVDGKVLER